MSAVSPEAGSNTHQSEQGVTLTVTDLIEDDDFESIYDVPFVTVNRVGSEVQAEVILTGSKDIDHDRISAALKAAGDRGFRAYARVFGEYDNVLFYCSDNPASGLIWALDSETDWL